MNTITNLIYTSSMASVKTCNKPKNNNTYTN